MIPLYNLYFYKKKYFLKIYIIYKKKYLRKNYYILKMDLVHSQTTDFLSRMQSAKPIQ